MLHRRVAYAAALAAALLFQIFFKGWFSAFLLALVVLFPVLALALSLPAILSCALELSPCVLAVGAGRRRPVPGPAAQPRPGFPSPSCGSVCLISTS